MTMATSWTGCCNRRCKLIPALETPRRGRTLHDDSRWVLRPPFGWAIFSGVTIATDLAAQLQYRAASLYLRKTL